MEACIRNFCKALKDADNIPKDLGFYIVDTDGELSCVVNAGDWHEKEQYRAGETLAKKFFDTVKVENEISRPPLCTWYVNGNGKATDQRTKRLGAGVVISKGDGVYLVERNHEDAGMPEEMVGKLRPVGGGKSKRDANLRETAIRELKEELDIDPEYSRKHLKLRGFQRRGKFADCAIFELKDPGLKPGKYQASNSENEWVDLVEIDVGEDDSWPEDWVGPNMGKDSHSLRPAISEDEKACAEPAEKKASQSSCPHCGHRFVPEDEPEVSMGAVACPSCKATVCPGEPASEKIASDYKPCPECSGRVWPGPKNGYDKGVRYRGSIECWSCGHKMSGLHWREPDAEKSAAEAAPIHPPVTGPGAIAYALGRLDLDKLEAQHKEIIKQKKVSKRPHSVQVLNVIEGLRRNNLQPKDLLISKVPVIPPAFRPFAVVGNTFVPGDANELYRDLFNYRDVHRDVERHLGPAGAADTKLALYDSVKALYGYGEPVSTKTKQRGVAGFLKQITGTNPKFSFVQRKLLSKPQDSVARGVIVVDPDLSLDEIGVPKEMAWSMYAPYIQRKLVQSGMSPKDALTHVKDRSKHAEHALNQEIKSRPVIYSRAPSWHKFNVLAGHPKLIDGHTIAINPLVTTGLNADFDGDTMNLHVPSMEKSVREAYEKLLPSKMLFSIRDQDRVVPLPKQEHILGLFTAQKRAPINKHVFNSEEEAVKAIEAGHVLLRDEVEIAGAPSLATPQQTG